MSRLAEMKQAQSGSKPVIKAMLRDEEDFYAVLIPKAVLATDVRDKVSEKTGKTNYSLTALVHSADGKPGATMDLKVTEGAEAALQRFGIGTVNLLFQKFVEEPIKA